MTNKLDLYHCSVCSQIIEVVQEGAGTLVCCNEEMSHMKENTANPDNRHFAHIEENDGIKKITFNHPATIEHHIEFIEAISNDGKYIKRKYLKPDEIPTMELKCDCKEGYYIRLYCNLDGVWITSKEV